MSTSDTFAFLQKDTVDIFSLLSEDTLDKIGLFTTKNTRKGLEQLEQKKDNFTQLTVPLTVNDDTVKVYHVEDIQNILQISRTAAYALIKKAPFRVVRVGSSIRISKEDFDRWLNNPVQENGGL